MPVTRPLALIFLLGFCVSLQPAIGSEPEPCSDQSQPYCLELGVQVSGDPISLHAVEELVNEMVLSANERIVSIIYRDDELVQKTAQVVTRIESGDRADRIVTYFVDRTGSGWTVRNSNLVR